MKAQPEIDISEFVLLLKEIVVVYVVFVIYKAEFERYAVFVQIFRKIGVVFYGKLELPGFFDMVKIVELDKPSVAYCYPCAFHAVLSDGEIFGTALVGGVKDVVLQYFGYYLVIYVYRASDH